MKSIDHVDSSTYSPQEHARLNKFIDQVYMLLADASQGTVDPSRARDIAKRAVAEACDNREGK